MKIMTNFTVPMKKLIQNTLLAFIPRDTIEINDNGEAKILKCYKIGGHYIATRIKPKKKNEKKYKMENMEELIKKVQEWSKDRNLHTASPKAQMCMLIEEIGELAKGINKQKNILIEDSVGDSLVVLIILCQQLGFDLKECLQTAYNEIKDRKGKMIDGTFVKEEDLK